MRYFITFACSGAHLHGDDAGSVDREHNLFGGRLLETSSEWVASERMTMGRESYWMDRNSREAVLTTLKEVCEFRGWTLLAAHVRTNHVHAIAESEAKPEKLLGDFKVYASRALNRLEPNEPNQKRWARHGSTRWLWTDKDVRSAIKCVIEEQGQPMAVFDAGLI